MQRTLTGSRSADGIDRSSDLAFARAVAVQAGAVLVAHYERLERVERKSAKDVVTEADHRSEALIVDAVRTYAPGDAIIAEESGTHPPQPGNGRVWIVDPLDGTVNYANGIPFFCVAIGLVVDGRPVVGVVHDPLRGETYAAEADEPARLHDRTDPGGRIVRASTKDTLGDLVVALALSGRVASTRIRRVRAAVRVSRNMGAAALEIAYVAGGRFDAVVQSTGLSAWDIAGAGLVAASAGAIVTDAVGGPWFDPTRRNGSFGILAAPAAHHAALLELSRPPVRTGTAF